MLSVLRNRDFGLLWLGQAVSLVGDGIYLVAIAWLVLDISNEPSALALVGVAWTLPMLAALLFSGVLSDRFERRRLLIVADLMRFAAIGAIAALALADAAELWQVIALVIVYGVGQALFQPAFSAIVPDIVPREQWLQVNAVRDLMEPLGLRFAGPVLGGLLIAVLGVGAAFVVDAATFAVSAVAVGLMSQSPAREESGSIRRDLADGFAYVRAHAGSGRRSQAPGCSCSSPTGRSRCCCRTSSRTNWAATPRPSGPSSPWAGSARAAVILSIRGLPRRHVTFMWGAWTVAIGMDIGLALAGASWQMCVLAFFSFGLSTAGLSPGAC
jgi:MFS family permease